MKGTACSKAEIIFLVVVEETGEVAGVHWTESIDDSCTQVASEAIKQMTFLPGEVNGQPVKSVTAIQPAFD
ncbi:MAG TPA: hypothetical protein VM240_06805 [Verrucomicrobiae bacterium]|nr:hypothetical protein [Verrucomicrobiae bacterium]